MVRRFHLTNNRFTLGSLGLFLAVGGIYFARDVRAHRGDPNYGVGHTWQFYGSANSAPLDSYGAVVGVGHNSGDSLITAQHALQFGAEVIEIDVVRHDGRLVVAHETATGWRSRFGRELSLAQAWNAASDAAVIELDLKESSPAYLDAVFTFIEDHGAGQAVIISTPDIKVLQ